MGGVVSDVVKVASLGTIDLDKPGEDAAKASQQAANTQAAYQREALNYLKEREELPQQFREGALQVLGGLYGLDGGEGSQQQLIDAAKASPLYGAIMGGLDASEEELLEYSPEYFRQKVADGLSPIPWKRHGNRRFYRLEAIIEYLSEDDGV